MHSSELQKEPHSGHPTIELYIIPTSSKLLLSCCKCIRTQDRIELTAEIERTHCSLLLIEANIKNIHKFPRQIGSAEAPLLSHRRTIGFSWTTESQSIHFAFQSWPAKLWMCLNSSKSRCSRALPLLRFDFPNIS